MVVNETTKLNKNSNKIRHKSLLVMILIMCFIFSSLTVSADTDNPIITSPVDYTYIVTTTGHEIKWNATDETPDTYIIYKNGNNVQDGTYTNATFININISGLTLGTYNYTCFVNDTSSNYIVDLVWVTVSLSTLGMSDISDTVLLIIPIILLVGVIGWALLNLKSLMNR